MQSRHEYHRTAVGNGDVGGEHGAAIRRVFAKAHNAGRGWSDKESAGRADASDRLDSCAGEKRNPEDVFVRRGHDESAAGDGGSCNVSDTFIGPPLRYNRAA